MGRYLDIAKRVLGASDQAGHEKNEIIEKSPKILGPAEAPAMPAGVKLVSYAPKAAPVAIDTCSVVTDVELFIKSELHDLDARLNNPWIVRGGWTIPQILDRLRQAGLEVEVDVKGSKP